MKRADIGLRECWIAMALAAFLVARLAPPLDGLSPQGQSTLGAMAAGAILWMTEATPIGVTAILVTVLLALCPGALWSDAVGGLSSEVAFFLIGTVAIGAAVEVSGLDRASGGPEDEIDQHVPVMGLEEPFLRRAFRDEPGLPRQCHRV